MITFKKPTEEAPCKSSCPAGIDVSRYVRLIGQGKFNDALSVIREKIPFPSVCGYVCLHPCESKCNLNKVNGPVAIRALKQFVAKRGSFLERPVAKSTGKKVAIVGSGPSGLTAGYYLAKLGHKVVVFEALSEAGGMMRWSIPNYRLPKDVLSDEINAIAQIGVEIRINARVESLEDLFRSGYDAINVAIGTHKGIRLPIEGVELIGVMDGLSILKAANQAKKIELGRKVLVLGGGNVAFDCARTALRLGATDVHIACLECRDSMLASSEEVQQGLDEGIGLHTSHAFVKIISDKGRVKGVECLDVCSFQFDDGGVVHIDPVEGSEHILPADTVIFAVGQLPELGLLAGVSDIKTDRKGTVKVDQTTLATGKEGVFSCGDVVTGTSSVIEAIAAGRHVAISIDRYLGGNGRIDEVLAPPEEEVVAPLQGFPVVERAELKTLPVEERLRDFSVVELSLSEESAIAEAQRCLMCDLSIVIDPSKCVGCFTCTLRCSLSNEKTFNPGKANIKVVPHYERANEISLAESCNDCGVCARYCPYEALSRGKKVSN